MNPIGIRRIVLRKSGMFAKHIMFSQNKLSCKNHVPGRGTAAVHCITLNESVANPGHSSRSLRNDVSFAMQIVVRNGHLASSGPKPGHRVVCVAMGPHRGPTGPQGGPTGIHAPARAPRRPESLVRCILAFRGTATPCRFGPQICFRGTAKGRPPTTYQNDYYSLTTK